MLFRLSAALFLLWLCTVSAVAQPASATRNLMPVPTSVRWGTGSLGWKLMLKPELQGPLDADLTAAVLRTLVRLHRNAATGIAPTATVPLQIRYGSIGKPENNDEERYSLRVTPAGVLIDAPTSLGVLRALATLEQLPQPEGRHSVLPEVDIQDQPRFAWRGLLIDAARHFMPVSVIKRNLDAMAAVKLNVFHWHLSDDQGFRVESKVLPRLHEVSGQHYTQEQVRDVLRYAAARGIRVLPEFDVPSHTIAWMAAYPQLASNDSIYGVYQSWRTANMAIDPTKESTYKLLDTLFAEMTALFPDPYFHIGGDENDGRQWRKSPRIMQFAREKGFLKADGKTLDKHALQTYFNRRVLTIVTKYNKKMVGWDEILGPGLPQNAVIQSWRGKKGLYDAAKAGNPAILSSGYYLDLYLTAASSYATDPLPADAPLTPEQQKLILGGEATMWAEFADSVIVDSRIWPRGAAVAERLWSARTVTDVPDMYRRLAVVSGQLEGLSLQHRKAPAQLLRQMAGPDPAALAPLRTLADVLEPVKEYKRHFQGFTYTPGTPLNRLVDAAPAESDVARQFGWRVDSLLAARPAKTAALPRTAAARARLKALREQLTLWQTNDTRLQPLLTTSAPLTEYAPHSTQLRLLATLGLERLTQLELGTAPSAAWLAAAKKQLEAAKAPAGQTELAVVAGFGKLLQ
ncbi:beta-N-acetylhexosaminidase [Hymenobacter psychrotolerans]|uniref:Hexosaminidase n=1 Tax=Hymenobacter psychrotolerans DSM 18569 TaxID=1121959 RepID=A0A1M6WIB8_9BACT|nr:family 20 glycosylhydrolase [Hymenobacter psychrotolerans]SHK93523.1 hexosaminidase [Hymenobacter psychrotolerans DSM 18569]